jgi:AcrR family transcriptional regulator
MLGKGSVSDIKINRLARGLGINKSGFYWHFKNRNDLLEQLLAYWTHELTEVVTSNPEFVKLEPRERLCRTAEMIIDYDLTRYEISIRQWALTSDLAGQAVKKVNEIRLDFVSRTLAELGFEVMITKCALCYLYVTKLGKHLCFATSQKIAVAN